MSHYTVLVINSQGHNDVEAQLAPYSEHTEMPRYVAGEVSEEDWKDFQDFYLEKYPEDASLSREELYDKHGARWNGMCWRIRPDGKWEETSTYNPHSKWDWYQVGGRWCGFFRVKEEADVPDLDPSWGYTSSDEGLEALAEKLKNHVADQAKMKDILWEDMMAESAAEATARWNEVAAVIGVSEEGKINQPARTFKQCREINPTIDLARQDYWNQPIMKKWKTLRGDVVGFLTSIDEYNYTLEEYINIARQAGIATFAVLKDGTWYEKGEMGGFGISSETQEESETWDQGFFDNFIKDLPEDALLTLIDCHI